MSTLSDSTGSPSSAAMCSGVRPFSSAMFTWAPDIRRADTCPGRKTVPHAVSTASQRVALILSPAEIFSHYFTRVQGIPKYKIGLGGGKDAGIIKRV